MSVPTVADVAQWIALGVLLPAVCLVMAVEAVIRHADRRARIRAARAAAARSSLGSRWLARQEQRAAARALRDGRA